MESTASASLAEVIKRLAAEQGKSDSALSAGAKIANTSLHRSLHGIRPLTYIEMRAIAAELGTTAAALVAAAESDAA